MPAVLTRRPVPTGPGLSRRSVLVGGAVLGAAWLSGCASGEQGPGPGPTRTVQTARGPLDVPAEPARVVTIGYNSAFQMQAVGARPVATVDYTQSIADLTPDQLEFVRDLPSIGAWRSANPETVATQSPDLIVGEADDADDSLYRTLSAIAPTYLSDPRNRADWQTAAEGVADALGRGSALDSGRRELDATTADLSARYADVLARERFALISFGTGAGTYSITYPDSAQGGLVASVGGQFSANAQKLGTRTSFESFPVEELGRLEDATVILYPLDGSGNSYPMLDEILAGPLFDRLPAVRADRVRAVTGLYAVTDFATAVGALQEFDETVLATL